MALGYSSSGESYRHVTGSTLRHKYDYGQGHDYAVGVRTLWTGTVGVRTLKATAGYMSEKKAVQPKQCSCMVVLYDGIYNDGMRSGSSNMRYWGKGLFVSRLLALGTAGGHVWLFPDV